MQIHALYGVLIIWKKKGLTQNLLIWLKETILLQERKCVVIHKGLWRELHSVTQAVIMSIQPAVTCDYFPAVAEK